MGTALGPTHLLSLDKSLSQNLVDGRLNKGRGNGFSMPSVWLDHNRPRSLVVAVFSPRFFPVSNVCISSAVSLARGCADPPEVRNSPLGITRPKESRISTLYSSFIQSC